MSMRVVDGFEVIEINKQHAEFISKARRTVDLSFERFIKMPCVIEAGAIIRDGQFLNFLDGACILNRDGSVVTERLQKESFLIGEVVEVHIDQLDHSQYAQFGTQGHANNGAR